MISFMSNWHRLTSKLVVANLAITKWCKNLINDWNPGKWELIWEYSVRAILWIPTWQGLDGFQRYLHPCVLDESSLDIGRVNLLGLTVRVTPLTLSVLRLHCKKYSKTILTLSCWYSFESSSWVLSDEYQYVRVIVHFQLFAKFHFEQIRNQ